MSRLLSAIDPGHDPMPVLILAILYLVMALLSPAAPASSWTPPETILIPAGSFVTGSDRAERDAAYRLDEEAYGHSRTRDARWYEKRPDAPDASDPSLPDHADTHHQSRIR